MLKKTAQGTYKPTEEVAASAYKTGPDEELVRIENDNVKEVTGIRLVAKGMGGATDVRFFANDLGIPTLNFGLGRLEEGNPIGLKGNLRIGDLTLVAKVCALTAFDLEANALR